MSMNAKITPTYALMIAPICGAHTDAIVEKDMNCPQILELALILMSVKTQIDALELASMSQEVTSATALQDTEYLPMEELAKTLMNVKKIHHAGAIISIAITQGEDTSVLMLDVHKDMKGKVHTATDAKESQGDVDQQILSV